MQVIRSNVPKLDHTVARGDVRERVSAIREALVQLNKLTADERQLSLLHYLIGMAVEEASSALKEKTA